MQVNDIVIFSPRAGETAEGVVTRVWDKPVSDPYVTIRTTEDGGRTFVRCSSVVRPAWEADLLADGPAFDGPDYVTSRVTARPGTGA